MNGHADEGDWSESSNEGERYFPLVAMTASSTEVKPLSGFSPTRAQSPLNKSSAPLNTTGGALGASLTGSFPLQGAKEIELYVPCTNLIFPCLR